MTYRTAAPREEEPRMPTRYTQKQDGFAEAVTPPSAIVATLSTLVTIVAIAGRAWLIAAPVGALAVFGIVALGWSLRVQWRYAGQAEK